MKPTIQYIDTRGMFPNPDSAYLVAWDDQERGRIMIGFSKYKDLAEGEAHISYSYESFYKDPIGKLSNYLDAGIDLSRALVKFDNYHQNKKNTNEK
jgi:hypothetical protein